MPRLSRIACSMAPRPIEGRRFAHCCSRLKTTNGFHVSMGLAEVPPLHQARERDQMPAPSSDIAFTPSVKAAQEKRGSRAHFAKIEETGGWRTAITADLAAFLADARSFYLATASADGQPYVQHRGGPAGFQRVLDEHTLGFADFKG